MKLQVLVDNNTCIDEYYYGEPALSYYIEDGNDKILFDVGYSDIFITNAKKLNIDLDSINKMIISHGHDDHTGGLKYFFAKKRNIELISHPYSFNYKENQAGLPIGVSIQINELKDLCKLNLSKKPVKISKNIIYLGEIPRINDFEKSYSIGTTVIDGQTCSDEIIEDSAIVYEGKKGLFIITGCSHSGICNIIEYAKTVCHNDKIYGVIGGFHLLENNERLKQTINYFKNNNIELLYPCHCVSLEAKIEIAKEIPIKEVGVGLKIEL